MTGLHLAQLTQPRRPPANAIDYAELFIYDEAHQETSVAMFPFWVPCPATASCSGLATVSKLWESPGPLAQQVCVRLQIGFLLAFGPTFIHTLLTGTDPIPPPLPCHVAPTHAPMEGVLPHPLPQAIRLPYRRLPHQRFLQVPRPRQPARSIWKHCS